MDIWVASAFDLLWIMVPWTVTYKFSYRLSVLLGVYLRLKFLSHMVTLRLTLWGTAKLFSLMAASNSFTYHQQGLWFLVSQHPYQTVFIVYPFGYTYSSDCEAVFHCAFDFITPWWLKMTSTFHVRITGCSCIFLGEMFSIFFSQLGAVTNRFCFYGIQDVSLRAEALSSSFCIPSTQGPVCIEGTVDIGWPQQQR